MVWSYVLFEQRLGSTSISECNVITYFGKVEAMKSLRFFVGLLLSVLLGGQTIVHAASNEKLGRQVVVSIKPIHSLVAGVMKGVGEPYLIVKNASSPHTYRLRPSDGRALSNAKIVFWVGPKFEQFLEKPISSLVKQSAGVSLMNIDGLKKFDVRQSDEHKHEAHQIDPHVWLDPDNAKKIVEHIAKTLMIADPKNALLYEKNALVIIAKLDKLIVDIGDVLSGVQHHKYLVFHDAYQYFEKRFGLNFSGAVIVNANQIIGARQLSTVQARVKRLKIKCIFSEPQFNPRLVKTVVENQKVKFGVLDSMGVDLVPNETLYFDLMRKMAASFQSCFR